jgi:hypothetical protein
MRAAIDQQTTDRRKETPQPKAAAQQIERLHDPAPDCPFLDLSWFEVISHDKVRFARVTQSYFSTAV